MVTAQADWSLDFDMGMTFKEWHGPVPLAHELNVFDRALKIPAESAARTSRCRRLNWTLTVQSAPRHFSGKLPAVGTGSYAR